MTEKQAEALAFITAFIAENGYSPSLRDIASGLGKSLGSAIWLVNALADAGKITHRPGRARSIELVVRDAA